jgi:hypothetical protein
MPAHLRLCGTVLGASEGLAHWLPAVPGMAAHIGLDGGGSFRADARIESTLRCRGLPGRRLMHGRGLPGPMHEGVDTIREQKTKNNENHDKTPSPQNPDRRPLPFGAYSPAGGNQSSCRGGVPGPGPPGKAMTEKVVAAPAPRSPNTTGLTEGAGDGFGCPSPDKAHAPVGKGVRRFFCDVHRKAKNGEGYRISFTIDGFTFKHVDGFGDIPAKSGDKIYIDTIPLVHTDDAIGLLRRGVEIYCLRRLTLVEKKREELKLPKTTRGDIKALMSIEEQWFRKLSEDFLIMRRMISAHRSLQFIQLMQ